MTQLSSAAESFARTYNAEQHLVEEQRGWSRVIALVASDQDDAIAVHVVDGRIVSLRPGSEQADVIITSDAATLCDILELRRGPNEPYVFGELTVRGPEADFLRLDYIATMLCPP